MATKENPEDSGEVPADTSTAPEAVPGVTGLRDKIRELERKVSTLNNDNSRLKNELRFTMNHQTRMSGDKMDSLQHEIDVLEARNDKLGKDLMKTEADLQSVRHAKAQSDAEYTANITSQTTALVERLTTAQREQEREVQAELNKALKWRESVITKMQEMGISFEDIFEDDSEELKEIDRPIGEGLGSWLESLRSGTSALAMQKTGLLIVEEVKRKRENNKRKIQELVDFLRQEIDASKAKKHTLENDVARLRQKLEMAETEFKLVDRQRVKTLQSRLQAAIIEKDQWKKKADKYEDALETMKIINSLQKSLSKEEDIRKKYDKELHRSQAEKLVLTDQLEAALQDRNKCVRERNDVIQERNSLALQAQQEYERAERLHRLVVVLRKKAHNSAGSTKSPTSYEL